MVPFTSNFHFAPHTARPRTLGTAPATGATGPASSPDRPLATKGPLECSQAAVLVFHSMDFHILCPSLVRAL